jgi:hypothetical protein
LTDKFYADPVTKGWSLARLEGFITAGLGVAGTAATLAGFADFFPYFTYVSALGAGGVLLQALLSRGWYDARLPSTNPVAYDTVEEIDVNYTKAKNTILFGSLLALAIDAYVIAMPLLSGPPAFPPPQIDTPVETTTETPATLSAW